MAKGPIEKLDCTEGGFSEWVMDQAETLGAEQLDEILATIRPYLHDAHTAAWTMAQLTLPQQCLLLSCAIDALVTVRERLRQRHCCDSVGDGNACEAT